MGQSSMEGWGVAINYWRDSPDRFRNSRLQCLYKSCYIVAIEDPGRARESVRDRRVVSKEQPEMAVVLGSRKGIICAHRVCFLLLCSHLVRRS